MRQYNLGRKRILDTHLAAVLYANGVTRLLTSNPADFAVFNSLQIATPQWNFLTGFVFSLCLLKMAEATADQGRRPRSISARV
jgi:hypothetical protein